MTVEFRVLGPLEAYENGEQLRLGGGKQRALLAVLLLNANEVVSIDRLIDELWGGSAPDTAPKALQVHVSQLRKALEPERGAGDPAQVLVTREPGYMLKVAPEQLDLKRFERLVEEGHALLEAGDSDAAAVTLADALALWRGTALADLAYESFAQAEIGRLRELRLTAVEHRIQAELDCGRHTEVVGELERYVTEEPLRERSRAQLMLALYRSGRQADALELYRETRSLLVEELGIEPGKALQDLHAAILAQDSSLDAPSEPVATPAQGPRRSRTDEFVGRETELRDLEVAMEGAVSGRGCVFLIGGEPGIGKSRLSDELGEHARATEARVLWGRCWEAGGAPAYWPWVQSLRSYVREVPPGKLRDQLGSHGGEVAHLIPELRELLPDLPIVELPESEGARFRLFDATTSFLKRAATEQPLVLVLEDLHAADVPSLLMLQFVASEIAAARMLVVGTYRDVELGPSNPLSGILTELERQQGTRRLLLRGFGESDVSRLIELTAGISPSQKLVAAIHRTTGGNPLFVGELVRLLVAEGRLEEPVDETNVRLAIPRGVREVITRRLTQVSDGAREVLGIASVLGREFAIDTLVRVSGLSSDEVLNLLDETISEGVIAEIPGTHRMRFSHVLIRDALYEELGAAHRMQLHRRIGVTLEELHADELDPHLAELAHHFFEAGPSGDSRKAYDYACMAGDRAARLLAYEEAVRLYELAVRVTETAPAVGDRKRCETLLSLGNAQLRAGDEAAAKETFLVAADAARTLAAPETLAQCALGYGGRYVWMAARGDLHVIPLLEEALSSLPEGDGVLRAKVMARLAGAIRDQPFRERRLPLSEVAVAMARRTGNAETLAYTLDARCMAILGPDTIEQFSETAAEVVRLGEAAGDTGRVIQGHIYMELVQLELGDMPAAYRDLDTLTRLAEESRESAFRWFADGVKAALALFEGRFDDARDMIPRAYEIGREALSFGPEASYCLQTLVLHRERGDAPYDDAQLRELATRQPSYTILRCALAALCVVDGRTQEAADLFDEIAVNDFDRLYGDEEWPAAMTLITEVCASLGDVPRAGLLYRHLLPYRALNAVAWPELVIGSTERPLGILAGMIGRTDDAEDHFQRALEANAHMGARPWVAHTQHDFARLLMTRGAPGDRDRGLRMLAAAGEAYRELGMAPWEAQVREELA